MAKPTKKKAPMNKGEALVVVGAALLFWGNVWLDYKRSPEEKAKDEPMPWHLDAHS